MFKLIQLANMLMLLPIAYSEVMENRTYIITSILEEPYLMERKDSRGSRLEGNDRYEGYVKDLSDLIARHLGIRYELRLVRDGKYGGLDANSVGGWNGMVGELVRQVRHILSVPVLTSYLQEADMAIAGLTITDARARVIDFSQPFMITGIAIMMAKPVAMDLGLCSFNSLFCSGVLLWIFLVYVITSSSMYIISRITTFNLIKRIVIGAWAVFTLLLFSVYIVNIVTSFKTDKTVPSIKSVDDLAKQTEVEYGVLSPSSSMDFFRRMWEFMSSRSHVFTNSYKEGVQRVRESNGKFAFLMERSQLDYINNKMPCNTIRVGENLNTQGYGVATPLGSPLKENLNQAIVYLSEMSDLDHIKNKWFRDRNECNIGEKNNWVNVSGCYFVLIATLILTFIVAIVEFIFRSLTNAKKYDLSR